MAFSNNRIMSIIFLLAILLIALLLSEYNIIEGNRNRKKRGKSMHNWLDELVKKEALKILALKK